MTKCTLTQLDINTFTVSLESVFSSYDIKMCFVETGQN